MLNSTLHYPPRAGRVGRTGIPRRPSAWRMTSMGLLWTLLAAGSLSACGETALMPPEAGMGRSPTLPVPQDSLIPTVHIAPAQGWPAGTQPTPMKDLRVTALATGLEHPRWVLVLPNGDVLVAESNKPAKGGKTRRTRKYSDKYIVKAVKKR